MLIVDKPFASSVLLDWLEASSHPVLANDYALHVAEAGRRLNLVGNDAAAARISTGERVYTCSENALSWIEENTANEDLKHGIRACKDKAYFRELLKDTEGAVAFRRCTMAELLSIEFSELVVPCVVKPSVGFCSVGVYVVDTPESWEHAKEAVVADAERARGVYPQGVVDAQTFVIEELVVGREVAVEAYFDAKGRAHVLNLFIHKFASESDTSDRLYVSSPRLIAEQGVRYAKWLDEVNQRLGLKNFCVHPEVREDADGIIRPIEFNPLRFAGMGGADFCWYAYGFRNYEAYLSGDMYGITANGDTELELDLLLGGAEGDFCMSYLGVLDGLPADRCLDFERFLEQVPGTLATYRFDPRVEGGYGFVFAKGEGKDDPQFDFLLHADLKSYLS